MSDAVVIRQAQREHRRWFRRLVAAWRLEYAQRTPRSVWGPARRRRGAQRRPGVARAARNTDSGGADPHIAIPARGVVQGG